MLPLPRWNAYSKEWNANIKLLPHDRLLAATLIPLLPAWLKPNHVTVARMFLTPVVVYLLATANYGWGLTLFLFTGLTDALDGSLARVRRQITDWGTIFDPVADKLFIGSALVVIVIRYINFNLGMALLLAEAAIIVQGWYKVRHGRIEPANVWGKIKMVFEVAGVASLLVALWSGIDLWQDVSASTLAIALVFAIVTVLSRIR